jgi:hypothetical protein
MQEMQDNLSVDTYLDLSNKLMWYLDVILPRACDIQSHTYVNAGETNLMVNCMFL